MQCLFSNKVTPLIVVGPPRCGTRFVTNMLNHIPGVILQGEIPLVIMNKVVHLIHRAEQNYINDKRERVKKSWVENKQDFMYSVWSNVTQGNKINQKVETFFYGYKSPFHERYFDFYNSFFHPVHPKYVCCVRSFTEHYLSVQARWPHKTLIEVALRYAQSIKRLRYMKESRPDDVLLFFLDEYKKQGFEYLDRKIFKPLGFHEIDKAKKKAAKGPANASDRLGLKKRHQLRTQEHLFLKIYPQPIIKYKDLLRDFG